MRYIVEYNIGNDFYSTATETLPIIAKSQEHAIYVLALDWTKAKLDRVEEFESLNQTWNRKYLTGPKDTFEPPKVSTVDEWFSTVENKEALKYLVA